MLHTLGTLQDLQRTLDGHLRVSFDIDEEEHTLEQIEALKGKILTLEANEYKEKRSLNANAYFWVLCRDIAKAVAGDKETIYLMLLQRTNIYDVYEVFSEAVETFKTAFRYVETVYQYPAIVGGQERVINGLHCYKGSSQYNAQEMQILINEATEEAHALGVSTWNEQEVDNLIKNWRGSNEN